MTNSFNIVGDKAIIRLTSRLTQRFYVAIDKEDLPIAQAITGDWYLYKHQKTGKYYARANDKSSGKLKQPMLHRLIAKPEAGYNTTHIDGDTLNCVKLNMVNRKIGQPADATIMAARQTETDPGANETPKAGTNATEEVKRLEMNVEPSKGVSLHKVKQRWEVSPFYEGKRYRLGYWDKDNLAGANEAVALFRQIGPEAYFAGQAKEGGKT